MRPFARPLFASCRARRTASGPASAKPGALGRLESREGSLRTRRALNRLSENQRAVVVQFEKLDARVRYSSRPVETLYHQL